jgi:hypothetical protein
VVFDFPFFVWFLGNLVWGETCRTYVNTDIQTLELPVPRRVKKVTIFIDFLSEKLGAASPPVVNAP